MSVHDRAEESKFGHLLQPIRDLAANWDINIANELEDYLVRPVIFPRWLAYKAYFGSVGHLSSVHRMFWKV